MPYCHWLSALEVFAERGADLDALVPAEGPLNAMLCAPLGDTLRALRERSGRTLVPQSRRVTRRPARAVGRHVAILLADRVAIASMRRLLASIAARDARTFCPSTPRGAESAPSAARAVPILDLQVRSCRSPRATCSNRLASRFFSSTCFRREAGPWRRRRLDVLLVHDHDQFIDRRDQRSGARRCPQDDLDGACRCHALAPVRASVRGAGVRTGCTHTP